MLLNQGLGEIGEHVRLENVDTARVASRATERIVLALLEILHATRGMERGNALAVAALKSSKNVLVTQSKSQRMKQIGLHLDNGNTIEDASLAYHARGLILDKFGLFLGHRRQNGA